MENEPPFRWIVASFTYSLLLLSSCSAQSDKPISSYKKCVEAGNVILRSLPPQCVTRDGQRLVAKDEDAGTKCETKKYCKDLCGDGSCQILLCKAVGCPCAESSSVCPVDCKESNE